MNASSDTGAPDEGAIELDAVEALSETLDGLYCRVGDRCLTIPRRFLQGSDVHRPGDRGRIVLPRWFATAAGLPVRRPG